MTCIVAIKVGNKMVMASDSLTTMGNLKLKHLINDSKIFPISNYKIGIAGRGSIGKTLQDLKEGLFDTEDYEWSTHRVLNKSSCQSLVDFIRVKFVESLEAEDDSEDEELKFELLLVTRSRIFWYWTEEKIAYELKDYWAIGTGQDHAIGCLYGLYPLINKPCAEGSSCAKISIKDAAKIAVESACKWNNECDPPVEVSTF